MCYKTGTQESGRSNIMKTVFDVKGMTCAHCVKTVASAVRELDPQAHVEVDLAGGTVQVESGQPVKAILDAITEAGYETGIRPT